MSALAMAAALALAQSCAPSVAPGTLLAVAHTESGLNALAIHDNTTGQSFVPADQPEAIRLATRLAAIGHSIDGGIGQINSANWRRLNLDVADVFDACRNLAAAAQVLVENYPGGDTTDAQQAAIRVTLAAYNAGPAGGPNLRYVRAVEASAAHFVPELRLAGSHASGFPLPAANPAPARTPIPPPPSVIVRPASSGRDLIFSPAK